MQWNIVGPTRVTYRTATLLWAATLLIVSLQPRRPAGFHFSPAHHVAHILAFGALAFLAIAGFNNSARNSLWPVAASFLVGFSIEFVQHLQNRQPVEWHDVRDNAIGILIFAALFQMVYRRLTDAKKGSRAAELVT